MKLSFIVKGAGKAASEVKEIRDGIYGVEKAHEAAGKAAERASRKAERASREQARAARQAREEKQRNRIEAIKEGLGAAGGRLGELGQLADVGRGAMLAGVGGIAANAIFEAFTQVHEQIMEGIQTSVETAREFKEAMREAKKAAQDTALGIAQSHEESLRIISTLQGQGGIESARRFAVREGDAAYAIVAELAKINADTQANRMAAVSIMRGAGVGASEAAGLASRFSGAGDQVEVVRRALSNVLPTPVSTEQAKRAISGGSSIVRELNAAQVVTGTTSSLALDQTVKQTLATSAAMEQQRMLQNPEAYAKLEVFNEIAKRMEDQREMAERTLQKWEVLLDIVQGIGAVVTLDLDGDQEAMVARRLAGRLFVGGMLRQQRNMGEGSL